MKHLLTHIFIALLHLVVCTQLFAQEQQKSALLFDLPTIDLGHIEEDGGPVASFFEAVNTSNGTIEVRNISTTCGCTTAVYDKKVIPAGEKFRFKVIFNPLSRPGRIDKQIFVQTSDATEEIRLSIIGYVNARERTVEELYPFDMGGGLRLKSNFHAFGYLEHGKTITEHIGYINTSSEAITLRVENNSPSGLLTISLPERIEAGATGDINICYAITEDDPHYGTTKDVMRIVINGKKSNYPLSTQVIMVDNFDYMDDISAPRLVISKNIIKFGDVNSHDEVLEQRVILTNEGSSQLIVRTIESNTQAVECIAKRGMTIKAGESIEVVVRLRVAYIEDVDNPLVARIGIISNDPIRPMQTIKATAIPR
jgi:hypothetical protein